MRVTPAVAMAVVVPVSAAPAMETLTPMLWATVTRKWTEEDACILNSHGALHM